MAGLVTYRVATMMTCLYQRCEQGKGRICWLRGRLRFAPRYFSVMSKSPQRYWSFRQSLGALMLSESIRAEWNWERSWVKMMQMLCYAMLYEINVDIPTLGGSPEANLETLNDVPSETLQSIIQNLQHSISTRKCSRP